MGFGLLFIGYFTTFVMSINTYGALFRLAGYTIILISSLKLRRYNRYFNLVLCSSAVLTVSSAVNSVYLLVRILYDRFLIGNFNENILFEKVMLFTDAVFVFAFHICLSLAIRKTAVETGVKKIAYNAIRNFLFIAFYYAIDFFLMLPFGFIKEAARYFSMPLIIFYLVWIVLELILIFSCYAKICDENDVDMPLKKSHFAFVNRMREERAKKEEQIAEKTAEFVKNKRKRKK